MSTCVLNKNDVCNILGISQYTIVSWYRWQKKQLDNGEVSEEYLPRPKQQENVKGRPLMWSLEMLEELKKYQETIVKGRNGVYGKYTNPKKH